MIRADQATFRIGKKILVDTVSVEIRAGEVLAILGPNGAGKSTLFKMLCGQNAPHSGTVFYDGAPVASMGLRQLARRRAVLPQSGQIPFDFTAMEVALLGRSPHACLEKGRDEKIVEAALVLTETGHLADRPVGTLSGGELQRVHLARVLAQIWEPVEEGNRALFLDEPTSSLDLAHQHSTLRLAREWAGKGVAVAVILHDLNLASFYADRIMVMKKGKAVAWGEPAKVLTAELVQEVFEIRALVRTHPEKGGPLVVAL